MDGQTHRIDVANKTLNFFSVSVIFLFIVGCGQAFAQADGPSLPTPATTTTSPIRSAVIKIGSRPGSNRSFPAAQAQASSPWQTEYNEALRRKSAGKKKMLIGAGLSVGGALIAGMAGASCVDDAFDGNGCEGELNAAWLGYLTSIAGGGMLVWGGVEYFDANGDLNRLESRRPRTSASISLAKELSLQVTAGRRTIVGLRTSW